MTANSPPLAKFHPMSFSAFDEIRELARRHTTEQLAAVDVDALLSVGAG